MAENLKSFPSAGFRRLKSKALVAVFAFISAAASAREEKAEVSMRIDFVAWGDAITSLSCGSGSKAKEFTAKAFKYSKPVKYSGPRILALHRTGDPSTEPEPAPISDEDKEHESMPLQVPEMEKGAGDLLPLSKRLEKARKQDPTIVALIPLPRDAKRATILLAPAAKGTFRAYVINDDPSKLPVESLRIHNLSPHKIAMKVNRRDSRILEPQQTMLVKAPKGHVIYELAYLEGETWKTQENNIVPVIRGQQTQLVVLKSRNRFFLSADGATGGFLQLVTLRRSGKSAQN